MFRHGKVLRHHLPWLQDFHVVLYDSRSNWYVVSDARLDFMAVVQAICATEWTTGYDHCNRIISYYDHGMMSHDD